MATPVYFEILSYKWASLVSVFLVSILYLFRFTKKRPVTNKKHNDTLVNVFQTNPVSPDFKWDEKQPATTYPFKDREYKLTMGIGTFTADDWLLIEDTYLDRIEEKTKIITNSHPKYPSDRDLAASTVFTSPIGEPAIREFYDVVVQYMCDKYPMYFQKSTDKALIHNAITNEDIPSSSDGVDVQRLLFNLVRTIEEDFIIMMPDPSLDDPEFENEYYFKGGVFAFAAGFDPIDKFNKPLTSIHDPIPGYKSKLRLSMNRYFNKLATGTFVGRANFSVQTHDKFYVDDENKGYHLTDEELKKAIPFESLDFNKQVFYRSERQMLTRLPKSGAIVFTIRTYLHPFSDFKNQPEEVTQRFIGALLKFPEDMSKYKGLIRVSPAAVQYLLEL